MAESERGVLASQRLDRRIPGKRTLETEIAAWEVDRTTNYAIADWHFTTVGARFRLKRLYPNF